MRPVTVPANPPPNTYDEEAQLDVTVEMDGAEPIAKQTRLVELNDMITNWVGRGCPIHNGSLVWSDDTDEDLYSEFISQLKAKGMDWGDARRALIDAIGAYCSYCSAPIFSHLAIEHRLPKSTFPEQTFAWSNFLLACPTCNSIKGNKPNQGTVPGNPLGTAAAAQYITNVGALNYLWPNHPWASLTLPAPFPFRNRLVWGTVQNDTFTGQSLVTADKAAELAKAFMERTLEVDRWVPFVRDGYRKQFFAVEIIPDPAWNDPVKAAASQIIDLMSLNRVVAVQKSSSTVDRRLYDRTITWFKAMGVRQELVNALQLDPKSTALLPAAAAQARLTIKASGFWGVWLQVLGSDTIGGTPFQQILRACMPGTVNVDWTV